MAQKTTNSLINKVMQLQNNTYINNKRDNLIFWPKDILTAEIKSLKHQPSVPTIFGNESTINMLKYLKGRNTHLCNMVTSVCKQYEQYKEETNENKFIVLDNIEDFKGFNRLPQQNDNDIFFAIEGDPTVNQGLEYLLL